MRVRPATSADAEAIASLQVAAWRHDYEGLLADGYLEGLSAAALLPNLRWSLDGTPEDWRMWVADRDGEVVGFASTGPTQDADGERRTAEVFAVYAAADADGVADSLLAHAVDDLRVRGFAAVTQWLFADHVGGRERRERGGWRSDGGTNEELLGEEIVPTVRYRLSLGR